MFQHAPHALVHFFTTCFVVPCSKLGYDLTQNDVFLPKGTYLKISNP
jgi:hypothetical protein